jgi:hypothetical protein
MQILKSKYFEMWDWFQIGQPIFCSHATILTVQIRWICLKGKGNAVSSNSKETSYLKDGALGGQARLGLHLGLVAAASALAGGLAVTWWHRKTLEKLQNPINSPNLQIPGLSEVDLLGMEEEDQG